MSWRIAGKAITGALGIVAEVVAGGTLHGTALAVAQAVLGVAAVAGIWHAPYAPTSSG